MKKIGELLSKFKENSLGELFNKKKDNFKIRASNNENIINQFNSGLDGLYNIIKFFDEKNTELKDIILNNENLDISDTDYSRVETNIRYYNSLIVNVENFREGEPEINGITNSNQYRQFQQNIQVLNQNQNNQGIIIEKYNNEIDNILNSLKISILGKRRI